MNDIVTTANVIGSLAVLVAIGVFVALSRWYVAFWHEVNDPIIERIEAQREWEKNLHTKGPGCSA